MNKRFLLRFKFGISKGVDTHGYRIVSLYVDGKKAFSTTGGGYDMKGTVFGDWLKKHYTDRLATLPANYGSEDENEGFYGLKHYSISPKFKYHHRVIEGLYTISTVDGACGLDSMIRIAKAISLEVEYLGEDIYLVEDKQA